MIVFLMIIVVAFLLMIPKEGSAQSTSSGDAQAGWGIQCATNHVAVDTGLVMTVTRASDSIASIKGQLALKIALGALSVSVAGTAGASSYNAATGVFTIPNTVNVAGGAGNAVFYLTSDKTSTGTALYANAITFVAPIINDATTNYTYGWTVSPDRKVLTVNTKAATGLYVGLLGLTLLSAPANTANGTTVVVGVKGY